MYHREFERGEKKYLAQCRQYREYTDYDAFLRTRYYVVRYTITLKLLCHVFLGIKKWRTVASMTFGEEEIKKRSVNGVVKVLIEDYFQGEMSK